MKVTHASLIHTLRAVALRVMGWVFVSKTNSVVVSQLSGVMRLARCVMMILEMTVIPQGAAQIVVVYVSGPTAGYTKRPVLFKSLSLNYTKDIKYLNNISSRDIYLQSNNNYYY